MLSATRGLRRGAVPAGEIRTWLAATVEEQVAREPGHPGIERMLPVDWFDRAWVRAERGWPSGRRLPRPPRWARHATGALLLAIVGSVGAYLTITSEATTEVIRELIAEPVDDPDVVVVPGPEVVSAPEEAPELFGDIEIGELPTYDLTGEGARRSTPGPTLAPPSNGERSSADDEGEVAGGTD